MLKFITLYLIVCACPVYRTTWWLLQIWNPISMCSLGSCSFLHPASTEHAFLSIAWEEKKRKNNLRHFLVRINLLNTTCTSGACFGSIALLSLFSELMLQILELYTVCCWTLAVSWFGPPSLKPNSYPTPEENCIAQVACLTCSWSYFEQLLMDFIPVYEKQLRD